MIIINSNPSYVATPINSKLTALTITLKMNTLIKIEENQERTKKKFRNTFVLIFQNCSLKVNKNRYNFNLYLGSKTVIIDTILGSINQYKSWHNTLDSRQRYYEVKSKRHIRFVSKLNIYLSGNKLTTTPSRTTNKSKIPLAWGTATAPRTSWYPSWEGSPSHHFINPFRLC